MVHTTGTRWARAAITLAGAVNRCCACTRSIWSSRITSPSPFGEPGPEPLVPEPVPHERNVGRRRGECDRTETVEFLLLCGRSASPAVAGRSSVRARARAGRAPARRRSSRCRRRWGERRRLQSASASDSDWPPVFKRRLDRGSEPFAVTIPAVVPARPGHAPPRRDAAATPESQSRAIARASAAGSSASYRMPSSPSPTRCVIRSMAGATTGSPDAMYSNSLSGDQKKPSDRGGWPAHVERRHADVGSGEARRHRLGAPPDQRTSRRRSVPPPAAPPAVPAHRQSAPRRRRRGHARAAAASHRPAVARHATRGTRRRRRPAYGPAARRSNGTSPPRPA